MRRHDVKLVAVAATHSWMILAKRFLTDRQRIMKQICSFFVLVLIPENTGKAQGNCYYNFNRNTNDTDNFIQPTESQ